MLRTGKCPACGAVVGHVDVQDMPVHLSGLPHLKGVSYLCPICHTILGVGVDPMALKQDTVNEIVKQLRR